MRLRACCARLRSSASQPVAATAVAFADPQTIAVLLWSLLALRQHSRALLLKALDAARVTAFRMPAQLCLVAEAALMLQLELPDAPPLPAEIVRTAGRLCAKSHFPAAEAARGTTQGRRHRERRCVRCRARWTHSACGTGCRCTPRCTCSIWSFRPR